MDVSLIFGMLGLCVLLAGLSLNLFNKIKSSSGLYAVLNILGGALLFYYAYSISSIPFMILQAAWIIVPLYKLARIWIK